MTSDSTAGDFAGRLAGVRRRIEEACRRAGRDPEGVILVGASKRQPVDKLREAYAAGLTVFGENQVQEAEEKQPLLPPEAEWHLLGPLQSNKAKRALELFDVVHSVDRIKIVRALDRYAGELGKTLPCFAEILLGGEETKHGFSPARLEEVLEAFDGAEHLTLVGLMTIPPPGETAEDSRRWFVRLRELSEHAAGLWPRPWPGKLSMGMSDDFEVAVEEGATHVRVGTALFGPRG